MTRSKSQGEYYSDNYTKNDCYRISIQSQCKKRPARFSGKERHYQSKHQEENRGASESAQQEQTQHLNHCLYAGKLLKQVGEGTFGDQTAGLSDFDIAESDCAAALEAARTGREPPALRQHRANEVHFEFNRCHGASFLEIRIKRIYGRRIRQRADDAAMDDPTFLKMFRL